MLNEEQLRDVENAVVVELARLRWQRGSSLAEVCESMGGGLDPTRLSRILRGERQLSLWQFVGLCRVFNQSPGRLVDEACRVMLDPVAVRDLAPLFEITSSPVGAEYGG
ncbi:helix-turn-helix domain-containing protein [Amycolatopsis nigrescens]|uniref:helix-turn-helix domain-containing protein n=1 Tax=Amycolatopsis nigrescens TaxID=381445 RepID=UPI0003A07FFB|nr:helix-turn-helix transcriptional regulator [Amycolatopsis nigrescens]